MSFLTVDLSSVRTSPGCMVAIEPTPESVMRPRVMGLILCFAACLIVSTNLLVALAILKLLLKKKSQSWCFVLNLALADALVGVAITGLATEDFVIGNNIPQSQPGNDAAVPPANTTSPAPGKIRCLMRMAFVMSPCTASIMSMFLISLDRYAAIKMPLRYTLLSGRGTAVGFLLALWISALIIGFLPVVVQELQSDGYRGFCALFSVIHAESVIVLFSVCFFPVLCVFVYIYLDILKIACSHQKKICQVRQAGSRTANHSCQGRQQCQQQSQFHQQLRSGYWSHVKALRTVAVLVGCFLVLWCPFFIASIVHIHCKSCKLAVVLENCLWLLGLSNSVINPLVYAFWQREVRQQLAAMFCCCTGRSFAAGPRAAIGGYNAQAAVETQACGRGRDAVNPGLLRPITTTTNAAHTTAPSNITSL